MEKCDFWANSDGSCVCPGTEVDGQCTTNCDTYYDQATGECVACPGNWFTEPTDGSAPECLSTKYCAGNNLTWVPWRENFFSSTYYNKWGTSFALMSEDAPFVCLCPGSVVEDRSDATPLDFTCHPCPNGTVDEAGNCSSTCDGFWSYTFDASDNVVFTCETVSCVNGTDAEGYCLDWCRFGFDPENLTCYDEEVFDMFTETPYICNDPFLCSLYPPSYNNDVWTPIKDDGMFSFREGFFEAGSTSYVLCEEWDNYSLNWNTYKHFGSQKKDLLTDTQSVESQDITYLCWNGRVLGCNPIDGEWLVGEGDARQLSCISRGTPSEAAEGTYSILEGKLAEAKEPFSDRYPNCLPNTLLDVSNVSTNEQMLLEWLAYLERQENVVFAQFAEYNELAKAMQYFGKDSAVDTPLKVDKHGNLCLNMYDDPDITRIFLAYNDGIIDTSAPTIGEQTLTDDYPNNVKNLLTFMSKEKFDAWTAYGKNKDGSHC